MTINNYDGGFIPNLGMTYNKDLDNILLSNGKQNYEMKREEILKTIRCLYESTFIDDDQIYMTDVYADGKARLFLDIIADNPQAIWTTRYRGVTTKIIELLSSNHRGLKENKFQLLSIDGV